jgi:hypothetical protein
MRHDSHMFTAAGHVADHSRTSKLVQNPAISDAAVRDDISNWASVPALRSDLDSTAENETVPILNATVPTTSRGPAFNRAAGPSRSIFDLIKTYSTDKGKFSAENPEQSLRTVRRSFFSTCRLMQVSPEDALQADHLPLVASALNLYYESIECKAMRIEEVFDMLQARFQSRTVQEQDLSQWQTLYFASQRSNADISDHDTLRILYLKAKRIHRSLPNDYSDDLHLHEFLLRACCAEPFCSKIPEEPAKSSSDAQAQLSAAITRYAAYKSRTLRARQMGNFPRRSIVERDSKSGIHYAETRSVSSKAVPDESETHYATNPSSSLQE